MGSQRIDIAIAKWSMREVAEIELRASPPESFLDDAEARIVFVHISSEGSREPELELELVVKSRRFDYRSPRDLRRSTDSGATTDELASLEQIGAMNGLAESAAVTLLRRTRGTSLELVAAETALLAARHGPLPERVLIECAYLAAVNGQRARALALLQQRTPVFDDERWAEGPTQEEIGRLGRLGAGDGPSIETTLAILRRVRRTGRERQALAFVRASLDHGPLPRPVREECAWLHAESGDFGGAIDWLEHTAMDARAVPGARAATKPASPQRTDGWREGAAASSAAVMEQILARDIAALGVRERHDRWKALAVVDGLTLESLRSRGARASKKAELLSAARSLEAAGELHVAAEMYALGGEYDDVTRLWSVLGGGDLPCGAAGSDGASPALARVLHLARLGQLRDAIEAASASLAERPDAEIAAVARALFVRTLRGPLVDIEVDGEVHRCVLGHEVTIGRQSATIALASPLVSRQHVLLRRIRGRAFAEDLGSHNGTSIAGARISCPVPVGAGARLDIAGSIPCSIRPFDTADGELAVDIAGDRWRIPLGEARFGPVRLNVAPDADEPILIAHAEGGSAHLNDMVTADLNRPVELSWGDTIHVTAPRSMMLRVRGR